MTLHHKHHHISEINLTNNANQIINAKDVSVTGIFYGIFHLYTLLSTTKSGEECKIDKTLNTLVTKTDFIICQMNLIFLIFILVHKRSDSF